MGDTMTTKEIAEALGVSERTVQRNVKKYLPHKQVEEGKVTVFTETEAALLLDGMKNNINTTSRVSETATLTVADNSLITEGKVAMAKAVASINFEEIARNHKTQDFLDMMDAMTKAMCAALERHNAELEEENRRKTIELDESNEWASVKRVEKLNGMKGTKRDKIPWQPLKRAAKVVGMKPRRAFDSNYGEVNTYHKSVWEKAYGTLYRLPWEE